MPYFTVRASYGLDAYKNFADVEAETAQEALAIIRRRMDEDPDAWEDQEFDFDCASDDSFVVEDFEGQEVLSEYGAFHRFSMAAPRMLSALQLAQPIVAGQIEDFLQAATHPGEDGRPNIETLNDADRQTYEEWKSVLDSMDAAIAAATGTPT